MRRLFLIAASLAILGACSSGDSCGGSSSEKKTAPAPGETSGMSGGGGSHGGLGEGVSFQGLGKKAPAPGVSAAANAATGALGGSTAAPGPAAPSLNVICAGFPNLAQDCSTDPAFDAIKKKCCPTGQVDHCQSIPGGALLIGRGCSAPAPAKAPAPTPAQ